MWEGKRKLKGWWDGEVKEAIKARKEACRTLRKRKKLYEQCPNEASGNEVHLWRDYQEKKRIAKDLVRKKRRKEREALIKDCQGKGGYYSAKFWEKAKWKTNKASKALKDKKGELHKEEAAMVEIAQEHFALIGKGMTQQEGERKDTNERYAIMETGKESKAKKPSKNSRTKLATGKWKKQ